MKRESSVKFAALLLFLQGVLLPVSGKADENYVRVTEPYAASASEPSSYWDMSRVTTTFYDGLGRPVETVRGGAGGDSRDVAFYGTEKGFTEYCRDLTAEMNVTETSRPASKDAQRAEYDFCSDGVSEFRKLLVVDDSGVFQKVENYESVLPSQTEDEKAFTSMLVDAINSPEMHTVEYVEGHASEKGSKLFVDEWNSSSPVQLAESNILPESVISKSYAGGTTFPVNGKDSYSLVVKNKAPIERAVITFHEVFGHGIPLSNGIEGALNDLNSVRTSNLIIRTITQDSNSTWGHSDHKNIDFINKNNPQAMPMLK